MVVHSSFRWEHIQGSLAAHKQKLDAALEIHAFNRDVDDVDDRINEKAVAVSSDDFGKDLEGVQALKRKQEEVERDMTALQAQLEVRTSWLVSCSASVPNKLQNVCVLLYFAQEDGALKLHCSPSDTGASIREVVQEVPGPRDSDPGETERGA